MLGGAQDEKGEGRMILDKIQGSQGQAAQAHVHVTSWPLPYPPVSQLIPPLRVQCTLSRAQPGGKGKPDPPAHCRLTE